MDLSALSIVSPLLAQKLSNAGIAAIPVAQGEHDANRLAPVLKILRNLLLHEGACNDATTLEQVLSILSKDDQDWVPSAALSAALGPAVDRLALQRSLLRYSAAKALLEKSAPPHGLSLSNFDWLGFDVDHTLLAYKQDAVNKALFTATARYLCQHGGNNARSYSVKDSARGSLLIGANLTGNRLSQYRALLVANLLIDARLDRDVSADTGDSSPRAGGHGPSGGAGPAAIPG